MGQKGMAVVTLQGASTDGGSASSASNAYTAAVLNVHNSRAGGADELIKDLNDIRAKQYWGGA